jgi:hypothetical protein
MEDVLDIEEVAEQEHSEECFCQLCRPALLTEQDEPAVVSYEPVAA